MSPLENLLDQMKAHVMAANFAAAARLAPEIEQALAALTPGTPIETLTGLQRRAQQNAACIEAARRGMRAAQRRLDELRRATQGIASYDGKGRRADVAAMGKTAGRF